MCLDEKLSGRVRAARTEAGKTEAVRTAVRKTRADLKHWTATLTRAAAQLNRSAAPAREPEPAREPAPALVRETDRVA